MKYGLLMTSIVGLSFLCPSPANAAVFSKIYAFGDSLSDNGNVNQIVLGATGGQQTFPPSPPYFEGRVSNGNIWIELLAQKLGIDLVDGAFAGATSGTNNTLDTTLAALPITLPGLQDEIDNFVNNIVVNNTVADSQALYTLLIGSNDYLPTDSTSFIPYDNSTITLNNISLAIDALKGVGAKNIMVLNLPNLGEIPGTRSSLDGDCPSNDQFDADCLNQLTAEHNQKLSKLLSSFSSDLNIIPVDINTPTSNFINNPGQFGLTNVTDACLNFSTFIPCNNPDQYLFWDDQHPTARGHSLIANVAFQALGIPEPSAIAGLFTLGVIGILSKKKV